MGVYVTLTICVPGHADPRRYRRALESAIDAAEPHPSVEVRAQVDNTHKEECPALIRVAGHLNVPTVTFKGGNSGIAKASALLDSVTDYCLILDGDDLLYPRAVESVMKDLKDADYPDLMGYYGFDVLPTDGDFDGKVWGRTPTPNWPYGRGREPNWHAYPYVTSWMPRVWSRRGAELLAPEDDMPAYDDGLLCYKALGLHQQGVASVWLSMSTDVFVIDRGAPNSEQKRKGALDLGADMMRARRTNYVNEWASSPAELPCVWPYTPVTSYEEKLTFLREHQ